MGRFWNLKTKFVAFLVVILLGCFLVQMYVHSKNEQRLLDEVVQVSEAIANDVARSLQSRPMQAVYFDPQGQLRRLSGLPAWCEVTTSAAPL